jgi:hypothetical protein
MMADTPAQFYDHKVTPEGLYIRGMTQGQTIYGHPVEIFVPRDMAESFGWIDPIEDEEYIGKAAQVEVLVDRKIVGYIEEPRYVADEFPLESDDCLVGNVLDLELGIWSYIFQVKCLNIAQVKWLQTAQQQSRISGCEIIVIEGYVIESENGKFLSKDLFWFPHDTPEEAWVHAKSILAYLRLNAKTWETKPAKVYPATRDGKPRVGHPFPFRFEEVNGAS